MADSGAIEIVVPSGDETADRELLDAIRDYLVREEATNTIQLSGFHAKHAFDPHLPVLVARSGTEIVGVAYLEAPFNLLLSHIEHDAAIPALAVWARQLDWRPPGVMGPHDTAPAFANVWRDLTGQQVRPGMAHRILATSRVVPPTGVPGRWRRTEPSDNAMLLDWFTAFAEEAEHVSGDEAVRHGEAMANRLGPGSGVLLWMDVTGAPVSVACYKAPSPHGIRIGPIYTLPEHRRRGYGGAVTAAATQLMLDQGFDFVCLYTDAANPTSNHIYEAIGYKLVADSMQYRFGSASGDEGEG